VHVQIGTTIMESMESKHFDFYNFGESFSQPFGEEPIFEKNTRNEHTDVHGSLVNSP